MYIHLSIESLKERIKDRMVENNKLQLSFNDNQAMRKRWNDDFPCQENQRESHNRDM